METKQLTMLAHAIQAELMTNGSGDQAVRLQLRGPNEKDLGGYSRDRVFEIIMDHLRANVGI